ncbi:CDP-alcohol phosphatidyltransferase family protein [Haloquadratum walsbyi]|jgi:Phosphatidylglycerophosphate synthase|uniref:Phosphatidylglycerophosphate synthase n=1 Tax=Haloquadratum walsbyi J07HQW2 TaxID=1238425 RepID=U1NHX1_9EURY|nr:CDP-alcohol phosphatidyltransferase family protein [Haloquadratum walsbyi]ERG96780.1 MAG: phosphatidylglycerophosphate synthase [Haloquadratum walsbyi J07HQW2]
MRDTNFPITTSVLYLRKPRVTATAVVIISVGVTACFVASELQVNQVPDSFAAVSLSLDFVRWILLAGIVAITELWYCYRHLESNHPPTSTGDNTRNPEATHTTNTEHNNGDKTSEIESYEFLGLPNAVTVARGALFATLAGFAGVTPAYSIAWLPSLLYGAGSALDFVDGSLARTADRQTVLGAKLDLAFDSLGFLIAPVVAILWGQLPGWYLLLPVTQYLFKLGQSHRHRRGLDVRPLPPSSVRRPLAGLQMAFITLALSPVVSAHLIELLAVAVLAPSLIIFIRDYLAIADYI